MPTLVKLASNYADEFDVEGFCIMKETKEEVIEMMKHSYMQQTFDNANIYDLDVSEEDIKAYMNLNKKNKTCTIHISRDDAEVLLGEPIEDSFGTNEALKFEDFDHYFSEHELKEITIEEFETVKKLFGMTYGHAPNFNGYGKVTIKVK